MYTSSCSRFCLAFALSLYLCAPIVGSEAEDAYTVALGHYSHGRWKLAEQEFESVTCKRRQCRHCTTLTLRQNREVKIGPDSENENEVEVVLVLVGDDVEMRLRKITSELLV